jgi:hypothetical protein
VAKISRIDHGKSHFSSGVDWTGPFGRFCECVAAMESTSKSGRRDKGNEWIQEPLLVGSSHELLRATERGTVSTPQAVQNVLIADGVIRSDVLFSKGSVAGAD